MQALLLIDIQNDFLPAGSLAVPEGDQIIPIVNALIPLFQTIIATQDWHPANHASFAANHPDQPPFSQITLAGHPQTLWPTHCVQNTDGAALAPTLHQARLSDTIQKGTNPQVDSYSAFFDNHHAQSTPLDAYLRANKITHLYLAGLATDYCVKATALDARELGYQVTLIQDACRGVNLNPHDVDSALAEMRRAAVHLTTSNELLTPKSPRIAVRGC